jgi:hypothetical protein
MDACISRSWDLESVSVYREFKCARLFGSIPHRNFEMFHDSWVRETELENGHTASAADTLDLIE